MFRVLPISLVCLVCGAAIGQEVEPSVWAQTNTSGFSVVLSHDGRRAWCAGWAGGIVELDVGDGSIRAHVGMPLRLLRALASDRTGATIACATENDPIEVLDVIAGKTRGSLRGHRGGTMAVAMSDDGKLLASCGRDGCVRVWNVEVCEEVHSQAFKELSTTAVAMSGLSDDVLCGGASGVLRSWTVNPWQGRWAVQAHAGPILAVVVSPDDHCVATAGCDGVIRLWRRESGQFIREFRGHSLAVLCLAFYPDSSRVVSGGADGRIRVWDTTTGGEHGTRAADGGWVMAVAVTRDQRSIVSSSNDGVVRVWQAP